MIALVAWYVLSALVALGAVLLVIGAVSTLAGFLARHDRGDDR